MKHPVSEDAIKQFKQYVDKWRYCLNLHDFRVIFNPKPAKGVMAQVQMDAASKLAIYRLGADFGEPVTPHSLESTALHEMLHVLLLDYRTAVETKADEVVVMAAEHRIVHTLERLLCPV